MEFTELKKEIKGVILETLRSDSDTYLEAVIVKDEIPKLISKLEKFFDAPAWPSNAPLPAEITEAIKGCGGVMAGQTLYFWNREKDIVFVMLWPWGDGIHITIKISWQSKKL